MYKYEEIKKEIFTEEGQEMFLKIRDNVNDLLNKSGAVMMSHAISPAAGDSWKMLACVDRLVELGEIAEIGINKSIAGQRRVFIRA